MTRFLRQLHIDGPLLGGLLLICCLGLVVLYSAVGENMELWLQQCVRLGVGLVVLFIVAQVPPGVMRRWTPWGYTLGLALLALVLVRGDVGQGAQRWLDLGIRFQPSEIMKLAVPMVAAWYLHDRRLPPRAGHLLLIALFIVVPTVMIAVQPDLGTSILIAMAGMLVVVLAGLQFRVMIILGLLSVPGAWLLWRFMHEYQQNRVLMLLNPESDPLGAGYNIIQSKIAIGSGGLRGQGWGQGSQSHLNYVPEHTTDFIFAVLSEEFGWIGVVTVLSLYLVVVGRCLWIAAESRDGFGRLLAGGLGLALFVYVMVNGGMISGLLPVVGVPMPLLSFGGTAAVSLLAGMGVVMAVNAGRPVRRR